MGDIPREVFLRDNQKIQAELESLQLQLNDLDSQDPVSSVSALDMNQIRRTLSRWSDFSGPLIPEALIEQFILQVVVVDDDTFNWTLTHETVTYSARMACPLALRCYYIT